MTNFLCVLQDLTSLMQWTSVGPSSSIQREMMTMQDLCLVTSPAPASMW